ncbi:MAG: HAMP domain-containing histidine kinase [Nocardioides sp.]|nr:HAMP domain-containing histidine kinase [Nocardioides sp.]
MRTLTARLVAVVVALVTLATVLIAVGTTLAMRAHLHDRLDSDVRMLLGRGPMMGQVPDRGMPRMGMMDQRFGTLLATVDSDGTASGVVLVEQDRQSWASARSLTGPQGAALAEAALRGAPEAEVPDLGTYRLATRQRPGGAMEVAGLPTSEVDRTLGQLVQLELLAGLLGIAAAGAAGLWIVRRQLTPLRTVAATAQSVTALPLASGDIDLAERVPDDLVDEHTEVGRVAGALNRMLDHVEESLTARQRSEQQVRQFVADASHELRTPLATITGYTELARTRPETAPTALDKVEDEAVRMTGLVEDLLLLARLDAGRPLAAEPVDLSLLLLEAVNDARVVDPSRQWRVVLPEEPLTVTGDAARLHQVVTNLLANARRHTPAGTEVTVTGRPDGFDVHDDGPGFAPDVADRAFERFVRGDTARTREGGGAGLGLSLVHAIVAAHGGTVTLRSGPGDTTVAVRLGPVSTSAPAH